MTLKVKKQLYFSPETMRRLEKMATAEKRPVSNMNEVIIDRQWAASKLSAKVPKNKTENAEAREVAAAPAMLSDLNGQAKPEVQA